MEMNDTLDAFAKDFKLDEEDKATFAAFVDTLRQAAPRLCQNPRLLAVALHDLYQNADGLLVDGKVKRTFTLTAKHVAHCASIERTLMSLEKDANPYDRTQALREVVAPSEINKRIREGLQANHFNKTEIRADIVEYAKATGRAELDVAMDALEFLRMGDWLKKDTY